MKIIQLPSGGKFYETPWGLFPSVTTILKATMPEDQQARLRNWRNPEMLNLVTKLNISRHGNPKMTKLACKDNPSEPVYIARILTHETL